MRLARPPHLLSGCLTDKQSFPAEKDVQAVLVLSQSLIIRRLSNMRIALMIQVYQTWQFGEAVMGSLAVNDSLGHHPIILTATSLEGYGTNVPEIP